MKRNQVAAPREKCGECARIGDTYNGSNLKQKHARSNMPRIRQVESERVCNFHLLEIDRLERAGGRGYAAWNKKLDPKKPCTR